MLPRIGRTRPELEVAVLASHSRKYCAGAAADLEHRPCVARRYEQVVWAREGNRIDVEIVPRGGAVLGHRGVRFGKTHVLVAAPLEQHFARLYVDFLGDTVEVGGVLPTAEGRQVGIASAITGEKGGPLRR